MTSAADRLSDHYPLKRVAAGRRLLLRARVWLEHSSLDRRLARGASPAEDATLELRADQLTHPRTREALASSLERALADADQARPSLSAAIPVRRSAIRSARWELVALIERLRAPTPVWAQGLALVSELVADGGSPLYQEGQDLRTAVLAAIEALDGRTA